MPPLCNSALPAPWIALTIGNSRLHWASFDPNGLQQTCDTPHPALSPPQDWPGWQRYCPFLTQENVYPELWAVSVVPPQTHLWQHYPHSIFVAHSDIPLQGMYPTLGLDRAIALWCAGHTYGWPVLVIDGGTALTFTGADADGGLVGGAILPGLGLQLRSLQSGTANLPPVILPSQLPDLWTKETETAIESGVIYGAIAGLKDRIEQWCFTYPDTQIILTGGDAAALVDYLNAQQLRQNYYNAWLADVVLAPHLGLQGIAALRSQKYTQMLLKSKINP